MNLPLDIKSKIACFDMDVWIRLTYIDDEFKTFSYSIGRKLFIDLFTVITKTSNHTNWKIFNIIHRENDQPAIIFTDGTKMWYRNGKKHRDNDQPAVIELDGTKKWYNNGKKHRDNDQPAVIYSSGSQYWYHQGRLHRNNDQATIIHPSGDRFWYQNGKYQNSIIRGNRPVIMRPNGWS